MSKGAIDLVVRQEAFDQLNRLKTELTAINTQIQSISQVSLQSKSGGGSTGTAKSIKENVKAVQELNIAYQKLSQKEKELLQWHNKLETTQKSLTSQRSKEIAITEKQASSFSKLNAELAKATKQYQDFQTKKAQGIALSAKEQGQLNSLVPRLELLSKAYREVGASTMRATGMNLRARSSFDSLGFSVAQMTREAPAFLNSMQTGFMALTNNIPIFVDEITKLKEANVALAASGKPTVNIFKQVAAALFSWQSAISAAIVVLTVLGPKIIEVIRNYNNEEKALERLNEVREKEKESIKEHIQIMNDEIEAIERIIDLREKEAKAIAGTEAERSEITKNALNEKIALLEKSIELIKMETIAYQEQMVQYAVGSQLFELYKLRVEESAKGYNELILKLRDFKADLMGLMNEEDKRAGKTKEEKRTLQDYLDLRKGLISSLQDEVGLLQERQKYTQDASEIKLIEQQIKGINELVAALKAGDFSNLDFGNEALQELLLQLDMSDPLMANMIRNQIRIADEMGNMGKATEGATQNIMNANDWLMVYGDTLAAFSDMTNAIYERQIESIEDELDALDDSYNHKKELLELEVGDEEAKNERLRQLEIEKFQEEEKLEKKRAKMRKQQAIIDKAAALFNIFVNYKIAEARAPAEVGPVLGIPLMTWLKIQAGLAMAAVLAAPIPKYKEGHLSGTHEGAAIVGDGGRNEVIQRKDGTFALTPNKSTLTYMKRGDKVHKSIDSFIDTLPQKSILSAANNAAMFASLSSDLLPKKETFDNSFKEQLKEEIVKSLSGIKIYNNDRAVGDAVAQALKDNMYRNKFL